MVSTLRKHTVSLYTIGLTMIYLVDELKEEIQVSAHNSLSDIINGIDRQDIFEGKTKIVDEYGTMYEWDSTKEHEIGTVFGYTLIPTNQKYNGLPDILNESKHAENPLDFSFKKH